MKRGSARLLTLAVAPLAVLALVGPASAMNGRPAAAQVTSTTAVAGFYGTGNSGGGTSSYDSSGGAVTVAHSTTGLYLVTFAGLGKITGGNVQVTSQSLGLTCAVAGYGPANSGQDFTAGVNCFDYQGNASDGHFSMTVTQPATAPGGILAYNTISKIASSYTLTGPYQYNSTGHKDTVVHAGTGQYKVTMPLTGGNPATGTVKVSAFGATAGDCQLKSFAISSSSAVSNVLCFSPAGALMDRQFTIAYAQGNNLMGQKGATDANAFAGKPSAGLYQPAVQYDSTTGARVTAVRLRLSQYAVFFAGSQGKASNPNGGQGNVEVTPVSSGYVHCYDNVTQEFTPFALVTCVANSGAPALAAFTVQWVVP